MALVVFHCFLRRKSTGKEVEIVWACDVERARSIMQGGRWELKYKGEGREEGLGEDSVRRDDIKEKGLSGEEVFDRTTWRLKSSNNDST